MITADGTRVYVNGKGVPSLSAIGHQAGRIARFNGATREYYPVLCHVLTCAALVPDDAAIYALTHDAAEICGADVPSPWKTRAAKKRESMLRRRMYDAWGLEWPVPPEIEAQVVAADLDALAAEYFVCGGALPMEQDEPAQARWEDPLFTQASPLAISLTSAHLKLCGGAPFDPAVSGPMFEEYFHLYRERAHVRDGRAAAAPA